MSEEAHDSTLDTQAHISRVGTVLSEMIFNIHQRALVHDASKLEEPEKSAFDRATPNFEKPGLRE